MTTAGERRRIAIACQGGGSHTAFTAGVLKGLLGDDDARSRHEIVGLSGTSGGAICALLAWYGLAGGDAERPAQLLDAFWSDNSATAPYEQLLNSWTLWAGAVQNIVALPAVSPYDNPFAAAARPSCAGCSPGTSTSTRSRRRPGVRCCSSARWTS